MCRQAIVVRTLSDTNDNDFVSNAPPSRLEGYYMRIGFKACQQSFIDAGLGGMYHFVGRGSNSGYLLYDRNLGQDDVGGSLALVTTCVSCD